MLERLGHLSAARPRRTLVVLFLFVALAGIVGGPVAGRLESGGGFAPKSSESSRAEAQLERATGEDATSGIVLLVRAAPAELDALTKAATGRLAGLPGISEATPAGRAQDGEGALVTATIKA